MLLDPTLPIDLKETILDTKIVKVENSCRLKKTCFLKWVMVFLVVIGLGFLVFTANKGSFFVNNKLPKFTAKFTNNNQDVLLQTQNKIILFNLPPRNGKFTGRKNALAQIEKQLNKQDFGVITQAISGLGGVGKTQLATEFAYLAAKNNTYGIILWLSAELLMQ